MDVVRVWQEPHVSISHDGDYAVAYVLLQQEVDGELSETMTS